jgi:uncharacterized protein (TIGR02453 family)
MAKTPDPHFRPALFRFLRALAIHNERPWFNENRGRYEADVKGPMLAFIGDFATPLAKISKHYVADPRPTGGSMLRVFRDTRFAKDKSPYKTNAAAQFRHAQGKDIHAPGFYLHLEPGRVFLGAGIWHPEPDALDKIRRAIADDPKTWKKLIGHKTMKGLSLSGESLQRPPKGYDPEHPAIEDLKRKDFIVIADFTEKDALRADFIKKVGEAFKASAPLMKFLTKAQGLPF